MLLSVLATLGVEDGARCTTGDDPTGVSDELRKGPCATKEGARAGGLDGGVERLTAAECGRPSMTSSKVGDRR